MSFDDMPPQPPINPNADKYAADCVRLSRETAARTRCVLDVKYGDDYWQKVDIYLPADTKARDLPVFMFIHGGGWSSGYKEWCGFMAEGVVDLPAIFISVSHRLIPSVAYPLPCDDTIAALKWVWDNIGKHGGSRDRIVMGGHSAGAHIAALLALHPEWLAKAGLPADALKAVAGLSGTYNRRWVAEKHGPQHHQPGPEDAIQPDSPIALASRSRTPFYLAWGGKEHPRCERSGRQMIAELEKVGCPVKVDVFPDCDHFSIHLKTRDPNDPWNQAIRGYLSRQAARAA